MRPFALAAICAAMAGWNAALLLTPVAASVEDRQFRQAAAIVYAGGALICHQRPERSFHLAGVQLPVCARCMGLYGGAAIGALLWLATAGAGKQRHTRVVVLTELTVMRGLLLAAAIPTLLTIITAAVGVWDPSNAIRAWFALPLGGIGGVVVSAAAARDLE